MTDAYDTLREMLANVPDDAQVYVEELESIVEWPGITAGTFRQLLAEIAGFEWAWEAREKAHDAALAEVTKERDAHREQSRINDEVALCYRRDWQQAKAQLATAKREAWYEVAQYIQGQSHHPHPTDFGVATSIRAEAENRYPYPATPSGELCDADCGCPSPEAREEEFEVEVQKAWGGEDEFWQRTRIRITPADAKRIVAMGMDLTPTSQLAAMTQGVK